MPLGIADARKFFQFFFAAPPPSLLLRRGSLTQQCSPKSVMLRLRCGRFGFLWGAATPHQVDAPALHVRQCLVRFWVILAYFVGILRDFALKHLYLQIQRVFLPLYTLLFPTLQIAIALPLRVAWLAPARLVSLLGSPGCARHVWSSTTSRRFGSSHCTPSSAPSRSSSPCASGS